MSSFKLRSIMAALLLALPTLAHGQNTIELLNVS